MRMTSFLSSRFSLLHRLSHSKIAASFQSYLPVPERVPERGAVTDDEELRVVRVIFAAASTRRRNRRR